VGFEPTNGGFADLSLGPLGYRAELSSIAKILMTLRCSTPAPHRVQFTSFPLPSESSLHAKIVLTLPEEWG
jgi:hypothetical protein